MDRHYKKLTTFLINNKNIDNDDAEIYEYAAKVFFQSIINIIITISIGLIFDMFKECLCFIVVFIVLRKFTGGLHAKKYINCLLGSIFLIILSLITIKFLCKYNFRIEFFCLVGISEIVIYVLAPIENKNKPISKKENKVYKIISIILSLVLLLLTYFLLINNSVLAYSVGIGLITVSFLIVLAYFKKNIVDKI